MRKGYASKTELVDLKLRRADAHKSSLTFYFSGAAHNLAETKALLEKEFPGSYIESDKNTLSCSVPMAGKDTPEIITDTLERIFDKARFKMKVHEVIRGKKHGTKQVPEVLFRLDDDVNTDTLYAQAVLDMLMRKVDPSRHNDDPMTQYQHKKGADARSVIVSVDDDICENDHQVM